jgi:hypothetical protein
MFGAGGQAAQAPGQPARCIVQALAARERVVWAVSLDPGSKLCHRPPLQVAGIDVIQERFADHGDSIRAGAESDLRGLKRPREAGVYADVDSDVRDVPHELSRFFATSGAERHEYCGVAVDPTFDIERRFAVSDQDAYRHLANLPAANGPQPRHHALRVGS